MTEMMLTDLSFWLLIDGRLRMTDGLLWMTDGLLWMTDGLLWSGNA